MTSIKAILYVLSSHLQYCRKLDLHTESVIRIDRCHRMKEKNKSVKKRLIELIQTKQTSITEA